MYNRRIAWDCETGGEMCALQFHVD